MITKNAEMVTDKLYNAFKKIREDAKEDCFFDRTELESSFDNTNKLMKYIDMKVEWNRVYRKFETDRKEQYKKTYTFYQTEYPLKLNTKDDYQIFIESDSHYVSIFNQCQIVKEILTFIDSVMDTLKGRAFEVKHALDYEKFKNGL